MPRKCAECIGRKENPRCKAKIARGQLECDWKLPENRNAAGNAKVAGYVAIIEQEQRESRSAPGMRITYADRERRMWNGAPAEGGGDNGN